MKAGKDYVIQFAALSPGQHEYPFEIGDKFFEHLEYSEIRRGNVVIDVKLLKQSTMMILESAIHGTVKVNCDICTGEFDLPIEGTYKLIVKIGGQVSEDEDNDIITIAANEHQLDLRQYFYESIALLVPIKRVHPPDANGNPTCDRATLDKLKNYLVDREGVDPIDPRWDGLKNIKLN
jgi:uncharacterized protein